MLITTFKMYAESRSLSLAHCTLDAAMMQFYNTFGQRQTDTGPALEVESTVPFDRSG